MGTFNTKKDIIRGSFPHPRYGIAHPGEFQNEGYEVKSDALNSGAYDISVTKGGVFKSRTRYAYSTPRHACATRQ